MFDGYVDKAATTVPLRSMLLSRSSPAPPRLRFPLPPTPRKSLRTLSPRPLLPLPTELLRPLATLREARILSTIACLLPFPPPSVVTELRAAVVYPLPLLLTAALCLRCGGRGATILSRKSSSFRSATCVMQTQGRMARVAGKGGR